MFKLYDTEINSIVQNNNLDLLAVLKVKWKEIHDTTNAFRYKILNLQERIQDNKYLLQLNPNRQSQRRTPEQITNICQPFDENKFNFTKVSKEEILFSFKENNHDDIHAVLVNVSPISEYHSLLCPSIHKCLPQVVTKESLKLAINIMLTTQDRNLRIGFNSLCALASVNHLHYHLFVEKNTLPVEHVKCKKITGPLFCFDTSYPIPAFCFEVNQNEQKFDEIFILIEYFLQKSIAHNIFITRGEAIESTYEVVRVIVWPRKSSSGAKQLAAFNVAVCELSGWFPVYNTEDFENLQAESLERQLKKWQIDSFEDLCGELKLLY